jgi:hypothetical protein
MKNSFIKKLIRECVSELLNEVENASADADGAPNSYEKFKTENSKEIDEMASLINKFTGSDKQYLIDAVKEKLQTTGEQPDSHSDAVGDLEIDQNLGSDIDLDDDDFGLDDDVPDVHETRKPKNGLSAPERNKISKAFTQAGLDGNGRFQKVSQGLSAVTSALSSLGFNLDMVSGDIILGDRGHRAFKFRRANSETQDAFDENPEIEGSLISFTWENLANEHDTPRFEILAYPS